MIDPKLIKDDAPAVILALKNRVGDPDALVHSIKEEMGVLSEATTALETAQQRRNQISEEIGRLTRENGSGDAVTALKEEMGILKVQIEGCTERARMAELKVKGLLATVPNLPMPDVPSGTDEEGNVEIRREGVIPKFDFTPKQHFELGEKLGMDFETAAKVSGARYAFLKGGVARLERALGQFMIDYHTTWNGYTEVAAPLIVNPDAMFGTGQLPKFAEDLYRTSGNQYLIPTAEVSLTNMFRDGLYDAMELGRFVALTPCFRAEAGSAGRDTRGLIRQHQFNKVELVSVLTDLSYAEMEHERMLGSAESILKALGLPYRVMLLCDGDMGFSARKTYDIEVWLPGQQTYREISSVSYCGDFQGRRMNARYRPPGERKGTKFVHTYNGSGLAVGRTLVAVLENYQNADGSITIPKALRPYMGQPMGSIDDATVLSPDGLE